VITKLARKLLDDGYPAPPWDRLEVDTLDDEVRSRLAREWEGRARSEARSMIVFASLVPRFTEIGMPIEVTAATSRLLADEARHTELCLQLAGALGGRDSLELAPSERSIPDEGLPAHLFVARWTVSMFCIGESASVGMLEELAAQASDPCASVVTATLLRDERVHDRFGWDLAARVLPKLTDDERAWLNHDLIAGLRHYAAVNTGEGEAIAPAHGSPSKTALSRAFVKRLDDVILPNLEALGLRARVAWAQVSP
jgi:hypothetical protein